MRHKKGRKVVGGGRGGDSAAAVQKRKSHARLKSQRSAISLISAVAAPHVFLLISLFDHLVGTLRAHPLPGLPLDSAQVVYLARGRF